MSIINLNLSIGAAAQCSSINGNQVWYNDTTNVKAFINPDSASGWIVWQIKIPGLPAGEVFNGIRLQGVHDFLVGGGAGTGRLATGLWKLGHTFNEFIGATWDDSFGAVYGSGVGSNVNYVAQKAGYTSTDIVNGTMYLGYMVGSDNGLPGVGMGAAWYRNSMFGCTMYTGADTPSPPPSSTVCILTNPIANNQPGKIVGQTFDSMNLLFQQPQPQANFQYRWSLSGPLLWSSNNNILLVQSMGTAGNPGSPYSRDSGTVLIPAGTSPGVYSLSILVSGVSIADLTLNTTLTVPPLPAGGVAFHEF